MEIYNQNLNKHKLEIEKILANNISNLDHEIISFHEKENKHNFLIFENKQLLAFVPISFEEHEDGTKYGSFFNISIPGPIFINNLGNKKYKKVLNLLIDEIDRRCIDNNVKNIKINFSDLIKYNTNSQNYFSLLEVLTTKNYIDKSFLGLRINLSNTIENIFKNFSKVHKFEIKKQKEKSYIFKNYTDEKISFDAFKKMVKNHIDYESYIKRLYKIYEQNRLIVVYEKGNRSFSSIFSIICDTVEYFVDNNFTNNHHSLIMETIKYFKSLSEFKYLNLGVISYLHNRDFNFSKKKQNISIFKKGFGGEKYLLSIFEKKYF